VVGPFGWTWWFDWDARDAQLVLDQLMIEDDKMEKLAGCLSQPVGLCSGGLVRVLDGFLVF
jgi:hypothetical protein